MPPPTPWLDLFGRATAALPRLALGTFPTPVGRVDVAGGPVWVKDDSACSPVYGGNKVRKLEYLLADARRRGCGRLVVWGDDASHTVAATALLGRANGFAVDAVVFPYGPHPAADAALRQWADSGVAVHRARHMPGAWLASRRLARRPGAVLVPLGGTTPLAAVGYAMAAVELADQVAAAACPCPDHVYVPLGTGGTVAGLLVGLAVAGPRTTVVAVRTVDRIVTPAPRVRRLVTGLVRTLGLPTDVARAAMRHLGRIDNGHLGGGYRRVPPATTRAVAVAGAAGLDLEPVFTGKAMACLLDDLGRGPAGCRLFWNTHDRLGRPTSAAAPGGGQA